MPADPGLLHVSAPTALNIFEQTRMPSILGAGLKMAKTGLFCTF